MKGLTYWNLRCEKRDKSISGTLEIWIHDKLKGEVPEVPFHLYEVRDAGSNMLYVVAVDQEEAANVASEDLAQTPDTLVVEESKRGHDPACLTYAYFGVLSPQEVIEVCSGVSKKSATGLDFA